MEKHIIEISEEEYKSFLKWKKNRWGFQILPLFLIALALQIRLFEIWFGIKIINF
jgi:hypothetical protein